MALVDTHTHVQHERFDEDRAEVIDRALSTLDWIVVVGDDLESSRKAIELVGDRIWATAGIHPHHAASVSSESIAELRELAKSPGVVAIGEIGLDYFYDFSPRDAQRDAFEKQLILAIELDMPVAIHCREADEDAAAIIEPLHGKLPGGIMHCFGSDADFATRCVEWGMYVSFAGNVTFPKAQNLRDAALATPVERMLVETDCPYLAPKPVRGKRCEPTFVQMTAAFLADLKGIPLDEFTAITTANAASAYKISF